MHRVVFLTADEQALVDRYKETRRRHPLAPHGSVLDGIRAEQELLAPVRQRADLVIDTSGLSAAALRRKVADELLEPATPGRLAVTFTSFGHKHGPPRDADLAFDVRFLPNPHYDADLRPLTGFDQRIVDYVGRDGRLEVFYSHLIPLLEYLLPQYVAEGKAHLMVAIGCTGGRHRSVAITEHLAALFRDRDGVLRRGRAPRRRPPAYPTLSVVVERLGVEAHRGEVALDLEAHVAVHARPERHGALRVGLDGAAAGPCCAARRRPAPAGGRRSRAAGRRTAAGSGAAGPAPTRGRRA